MKKIIFLAVKFILIYLMVYACLYLNLTTKEPANPPDPTVFKMIVFFVTLFFSYYFYREAYVICEKILKKKLIK